MLTVDDYSLIQSSTILLAGNSHDKVDFSVLLAYFGVKSVPFGQSSDFQYHTSN